MQLVLIWQNQSEENHVSFDGVLSPQPAVITKGCLIYLRNWSIIITSSQSSTSPLGQCTPH